MPQETAWGIGSSPAVCKLASYVKRLRLRQWVVRSNGADSGTPVKTASCREQLFSSVVLAGSPTATSRRPTLVGKGALGHHLESKRNQSLGGTPLFRCASQNATHGDIFALVL